MTAEQAPLTPGRSGTPTLDRAAAQRRTVRVLVATQAVGAVGITIGIATASLLARDISGSESQAGLAQTFQVLGAAVAAYLLARLMSLRGRRIGLTTGYLVGAGGAVLAVVAGAISSMPLLLLGALGYGASLLAPQMQRPNAWRVLDTIIAVVMFALAIGMARAGGWLGA